MCVQGTIFSVVVLNSNTVVDDFEDSVAKNTIPDFVTNVSPKPSKGKEKDEGAPPSKVATVPCK